MKQVEAPLDPTKELSRLIAERKYEEAFTGALHRSDVSIVSWLCSQVYIFSLSLSFFLGGRGGWVFRHTEVRNICNCSFWS